LKFLKETEKENEIPNDSKKQIEEAYLGVDKAVKGTSLDRCFN
jgi:hypothetical protein